MSGTGITCTVTGTPSVTTVTASCVILASAAAMTRSVTVHTPDATGGTLTLTDAFNVGTATLASIAPTSGERGTTVPVILTGTGLASATGVTMSGGFGGAITCTLGTKSATTVNASCVIPANASMSANDVTVDTPGGNSTLPAAFQVTGARLVFSTPSPALNGGATTTETGTITVSNTSTGATAGPFTFTAAPTAAKLGTAGGTFSIAAGGTCVSGFALNSGGTCTILLQYAPGGSTATVMGNVTVTGTGLATATLTSQNYPAN